MRVGRYVIRVLGVPSGDIKRVLRQFGPRLAELAVLREQSAVLRTLRPAVDLARPHDRQRVAQRPVLRVAQVPPQRAAGGLVVAARLPEERVHVELVRKGGRPTRQLHQRADDRARVLRHQQSGSVAGELGCAQPPEQPLLQRGRDDRQDAHRPGREHVGHGEPQAVVALEVAQLVGEHALQLLWRQQLQQRSVHHNEGLAAVDGQRVRVGLRVLADVELRRLHAQNRARLH
mmetsp:Transcript_34567/g.88458  ORF Transcript_34567/g.88458 Transcript_34567/m.88458 type:complete len:232 (+) Transcript_34567:147-842(+)